MMAYSAHQNELKIHHLVKRFFETSQSDMLYFYHRKNHPETAETNSNSKGRVHVATVESARVAGP